jgi:uncharacterized membrane protein
MKPQRSRAVSWSVVVAASLVVATASAPSAYADRSSGRAPCAPRIIDLGTLGGANSEIDGGNRTGTWVGSADDPNGVPTPVLWRGDSMQTLGESDGFAGDVTNAGVVVGVANADTPSSSAFWWYRGTAHSLPTPSWATASSARRINQHNDAVGTLTRKDGSSVPVEWRALRTVRVLPLPADALSGEALGINDSGHIVGDVSTDVAEIAWEWGPGGSSHPLQPEYTQGFSQANIINDRGWVAGGLDFGGQFGLWASVWRYGSVSKLGQFGSDLNFGFAFGGDQIGDYVGAATYTTDDQFLHVFITRAGSGTLRTLMPLSGDLLERSNAHAVVPSYGGQGVAVGGDSDIGNGDIHATVWTCAYQQALAPPAITARAAAGARVPAWRHSLNALRP